MTALDAGFAAHLSGGVTTVARCWAVTRRDGTLLAFTDHDLALEFDGLRFRPEAGLSAGAVQQSTGLAVDNSEALGVLSHAAITEEEIAAGRYDGAEVTAWLVNWADPSHRTVLFRGTLGEVERAGGGFTAELRGLTEALNQPRGRVYQAPCSAVLGDARCRVDLDQPAFSAEGEVLSAAEGRSFEIGGLGGHAPGWFERGTLTVLEGPAEGLTAPIKAQRETGTGLRIELWEALRSPVAPGASVRLTAGCDKRAETCRSKFSNLLNFQGFPHIPGEDWLMAYPTRSGRNDGGSLT